MSPRPDTWMPLYINDYRGDTHDLKFGEHGVYLLLLMECWKRDGLLPPDTARLASIACCPLPIFRKMLPVLERFFQIGHDGWRHKRIDIELDKAHELIDRRSAAGRAGVEARRKQRSSFGSTIDQSNVGSDDNQTFDQTASNGQHPRGEGEGEGPTRKNLSRIDKKGDGL